MGRLEKVQKASQNAQEALTSQLDSLKGFDASKHYLTVDSKTRKITIVPKTAVNLVKHLFGCFKADQVMRRFIELQSSVSKYEEGNFIGSAESDLTSSAVFSSFSTKMCSSSGKSVARAAFIARVTFSKADLEQEISSKFAKAVGDKAWRSGFTSQQTKRFVNYAKTYAENLTSKGIYKADKEIAKDAKRMIKTAKAWKSHFRDIAAYGGPILANLPEFQLLTDESSGLPRATRKYLEESFSKTSRIYLQTSTSRSYSYSSSGLPYSQRRANEN